MSFEFQTLEFTPLLAVFTFWASFAFSIGPFWISIMQVVNQKPFKSVCIDYALYIFASWIPQVIIIALMTNLIGQINLIIFTILHLVGGGVIFYLCYKIIISKMVKVKNFDFNFNKMVILSWSNPKVWIMLPVGAISAQLTDSIWINCLIFVLCGSPFYLFGFLTWAFLGKLGGKVSFSLMSYINVVLLACFGFYILYQGIWLIIG